LEKKGVVRRRPSTEDGRGVLVTLTARGRELFDQVAPDHLANEDVLLSALTEDERDQLAGLLRRLLVGFELEHAESPLGLTLAPAHVARRARRTVGLTDRSGLLVEHVHPDTPASRAGLKPGDLIVALDGRPLRSTVDLAGVRLPLRLRVLGGEKERDVQLSAERAGQPKP
jgi:S1-C subfamily serine protease